MKWLVVVLAVVFVAYVMMTSGDGTGDAANSPAVAVPEPADDAGAGLTVAVPASQEERDARAEDLQTQIQNLMSQYDLSQDDPERRRAIQAQIDRLVAEYNQVAVPVPEPDSVETE